MAINVLFDNNVPINASMNVLLLAPTLFLRCYLLRPQQNKPLPALPIARIETGLAPIQES